MEPTRNSPVPESWYAERRPHRDLWEHLACTWVSKIGTSGVPYTDRVLPDGCIAIIWKGHTLIIAGPDTASWPVDHEPHTTFAGVRFRPGRAPADPLVDAVVAALTPPSHCERGIVSRMAKRFEIGERQLLRRCTASVGYGPKTLDRVLRFRRFLAAAHAAAGGQRDLASLAASCGYSDQAHLARECRRLSGSTPSDLFKTGR